MSRLIVYLKLTTMDKVLSLIGKLKKYDIVDDVAHVTEEASQQMRAADGSLREPTIIKSFPMRDAYPAGHKPRRR